MDENFGLLMDGARCGASDGATMTVKSPATEEIIGAVPKAAALAASEAPFGGTSFSGMGREGCAEGTADYLDTKLAQVAF
ncbi:hypothetical protein RDV64_18325 [Acuticoccus sp. MNP-M23]|uniref:hypothetical protein n=1 Tax=Acuticoccus sp. MNP-M23 TaxID=3072793 RepID=UPI002814CDF3|nr:hypothetical protein [Acuticoccus sp. MNP-M23]WMS42005.1 hypothetical protein RDV64_18325 [Acuticoccus sp. MNP-M23]